MTKCELCRKNRAFQKCLVAGEEMWLCRDCIRLIFKKFFPEDPITKTVYADERDSEREGTPRPIPPKVISKNIPKRE